MSDDDVFATLSGSLMKDLLADLAVDDGETGWMSLEELERELSHLEKGMDGRSSANPSSVAPTSAAAMVMANNRNAPVSEAKDVSSGVDAWSLSFQKFSAASLGEDFLQADSARKQQQKQRPPASLPPGLDIASAQDYNINEGLRIVPPPGIFPDQVPAVNAQDSNVISDVAAQLLAHAQDGSTSKSPPPPRESDPLFDEIPKPVPATPQNSMTIPESHLHQSQLSPHGPRAIPAPPPATAATPNLLQHPPSGIATGLVAPMPPGNLSSPPPRITVADVARRETPVGIPHGIPAQGAPPIISPPGIPQGMGPPQAIHMPPSVIPVAVPVRGPAWQHVTPPIRQVPSRQRYCDPHPRAPPIPATTLESKYMKSRDIGYVVHGILRHIQAAGASSVDDYDVQYWVRRNGNKAAEQAVLSRPSPNGKKQGNNSETEFTTEATLSFAEQRSRESKAMEWSTEHGALGHISKTNVHRPRALIAQPVVAESHTTSNDQRQRATLWKARIYTDQAYQAFNMVIELWRTAPPGQVPASMQPHLLKLLKCMGIQKIHSPASREENSQYYEIDEDAMKLLLRLTKGKVLLCRVLEQALLPPKAVQASLPAILKILLSSSSSGKVAVVDTPADNRIFGVLSRIVETLQDLAPKILLASVQVSHQYNDQALASTARMQCAHALLQRGGRLSQDPAVSSQFKAAWSVIEESFLQILSSM